MPIDTNLQTDWADAWGEKECEDISNWNVVVGSVMDTAHTTPPDISYAIAALLHYNLW